VIRLDKWLWQARFFKTRALAADLAESGHLRINGQPTRKPGAGVGAGDVLTFPQGAPHPPDPRAGPVGTARPGGRGTGTLHRS